jgi:hypothetical protein
MKEERRTMKKDFIVLRSSFIVLQAQAAGRGSKAKATV